MPGIVFTYYRGGSSQNSPIYDEIHINIEPNAGPVANQSNLKLIAAIKKSFKAFDPERSLLAGAGHLEAQATALHQSTLLKLEEAATGIVTELALQQRNLGDEYLKKQKTLEEKFSRSEKQLEDKYELQVAELRKREDDLQLLQASIDDRDNTHARRETRNKLLIDVKNQIENFGVTAVTERKRLPVMAAFFIILVALTAFSAVTWMEMFDYHRTIANLASLSQGNANNPTSEKIVEKYGSLLLTKTDLYILWIRFTFLAVSIIGTIFYFIRWQTRWAEQNSGAEFQLQQFYLDVNRANWVVESGLEWQKETGFAIPDELLGRLTHNLFKAAVESPAAIHPADELASALLGSASKLKLKAGNNEIEFDKPAKIPEKTKSTS
jgi:hypothetical protein